MNGNRNHKPKLIGVQPKQVGIKIMVTLMSMQPEERMFNEIFKDLIRHNKDVKTGVEAITSTSDKEAYTAFCTEMSKIEVHIYTFIQMIPGAPVSMGVSAITPGAKHVVAGRKYRVVANTFESSETGLTWFVEVERVER